MAGNFEDIVNPRSFVAGQDFRTVNKQFTFVRLNSTPGATAGQLVTPSLGGNALGVVQNKPLAGEPGQVCGPGDTTKIQCGGTFALGDRISCDASGMAIISVSGDYILGHARTAGAAGQLATIVFQPTGRTM
jgi:hypothetical protein